jgi:response regulator RpfG family c-di-GMP phosphodiesterase
MGLQTDMSVVFLVPENFERLSYPAFARVTPDQIYEFTTPTEQLIEVIRDEIHSVVSNQPAYSIMCIDDDEEFLASLKNFLPVRLESALPRFALNFEFFANPQEALDEITTVTTGRPAIIICDQVMPEMQGIELLRKSKSSCPQARRVLLTGHAALSSAVTAINEQVLDKYFFKPVEDPVDFTNSIRHLLLEHHLHSRTDMQRNHLMSQFEFIRTISAAESIDDALSVTVDFLREQILPQQVIIALERDGDLTVGEGYRLPVKRGEQSAVTEDGILEWVHRNRRSIAAGEIENLPADITPEPNLSCPLLAMPLVWGDESLGVILAAEPTGKKVFTRGEKMLMSFVADVASATIIAFNDRRALENTYVGTMATLVEIVEAKDSYTRGHTERVRDLAVELAETVGVDGDYLREIRQAAELHDIGKIGIPDQILWKPGSLSEEEFLAIMKHSLHADKILQHLKFLNNVRIVIRAHHERYDGKGYPDGLVGEEIPIGARIIAIADTYDAMTSTRPYRQAIPHAEALLEIEQNAGTQFEPRLVAAFSDMMRKDTHRQLISTTENDQLLQEK